MGGCASETPCTALTHLLALECGPQQQRLLRAGFTVLQVGERLLVPAEEACGLAILFER